MKEKIKEVENALSVGPLLKNPLAIPSRSNRLEKTINILSVVESYIINNISERLQIIESAWLVSFDLRHLKKRTRSFVELVKSGLKGDGIHGK